MVIQGFQLQLKLSAPVGGSWCIFSQLDETPLSHCLSGPSGVNRAEELLVEQPYKMSRETCHKLAYHLVGVIIDTSCYGNQIKIQCIR